MSEKEKALKIEILEMLIDNANKIEKDNQFRYYFGLAKLYVKEELKEEFDEFAISNYRYGNFKSVIKLTAVFAHEINNSEETSLYNKLSDLITTVDSNGMEKVVEIMDNYIINGEKIHNYLFRGTTSDFVRKQKIKINKIQND